MSTTTETTMPDWLSGPASSSLKQIQKWLKSDKNYVYGTKKGQSLFTPMNSMQNKAISNADWMADQDIGEMFGLDQAKGYWDEYANAGKVNGGIGNVQDYMSPYTQGVLDPAIREIQEESERQRRGIGASAAMSGAFGDARHGVMEGQNMEKTNQAVSDTTGRIMADAFNNGQAQRNLAVERLGTAAAGVQGVGDDLFGKVNEVNDRLTTAGNTAYNFQEKKRQTMQQFQEALKNKRYDDALKLLSAVNGAPKESTTETESDTGIWGLLGALAGGLF
jgi:hypothetical protein